VDSQPNSEKASAKTRDPCLPIYLHIERVRGLLSQLEDGISDSFLITTAATGKETKNTGFSAGVRANIPILGGGSVKGGLGKGKEENEALEISRELRHTPSSLLYKCLNRLDQDHRIVVLESAQDFDKLKRGNIVEFWATLKNNPLNDALNSIKELANLASLITDPKRQIPKSRKRKVGTDSIAEYTPKQIAMMLAELIQSNSLELVGEMLDVPGGKAVLSVEPSYFIDQGSSDVVSGEFRILGTTLRIIKPLSEDSIDLLRNTKLGHFDRRQIDQIKQGYLEMQKTFRLPDFITEIQAPALQIIPIAIYV
jgi:hypothetical protein